MTRTIPAEIAAFLARMPAEMRAELRSQLRAIDALHAKRAALEERRAKAAATAVEIDAAANARELAGEPDIELPCDARIERLLDGTKPSLLPHVQREQVRRRNAEREATRRQLQADSQALGELAVKLGREIEDLDEAIKRKRQAFLRELIRPLVAGRAPANGRLHPRHGATRERPRRRDASDAARRAGDSARPDDDRDPLLAC
jgi:hypothetical protein